MKLSLSLFFVLFVSFTNAQLTNGLIAMFPFDQNYNDLGPSAINLTPFGTTFVPDRVGLSNHGLAFGNQHYLVFNDNAVKVPLPITISVWVNVQSFSNFNMIFISDNVYNNYYGYWLNIAANTGQVGVHVAGGLGGANSSNRRTFLTTNGLTLNTWHHIVAVINGALDMKVYIDCELQNGTYQGTGATNMTYSSANSCIGGYIGNSTNSNGAYLIGTMDQLVFWNRALNYDEVRQLCENDNSLALDETSITNGVLLYPNPFSNELHLSSALDKPSTYELHDINGKLLLNGVIEGQTNQVLDLNHLAPGTYLLKSKYADQVFTQRLVKQ